MCTRLSKLCLCVTILYLKMSKVCFKSKTEQINQETVALAGVVAMANRDVAFDP